ncbi:Homeodomain-like domain-containing protein [Fulvimarina manganoxydans]|uniref:Homeodomain-like domain-containing protein n=1 Tax=Fulvimarina manganoxydans TaxID=937218 RepID=A0A1W2D5P7_9HYPH|nr:winged helix-turn-helix domain-containing protein [Fulvimarina manganoxydans]SMC92368.1 Homeodomain-like domain-containing protein [Fulvimarina manganoxydans]
MTTRTASKLDTTKFQKVCALMRDGATEGERAAAKHRAETMAAKAGMTLQEAVSNLDMATTPKPASFFDGFDDWMEEKEPGWKAERAREKAERKARDDVRRAAVLEQHGSEEFLFARTMSEIALDAAIEPFATWEYWTDPDGTRHRYASTLDGMDAGILWKEQEITPAVRRAIIEAYPWPSKLDDALREVKEWDQLRLDRGLFCGEWSHYVEVEIRIRFLERELNEGRPATSLDDIQARFNWKRYEFERQWLDPTERDDPFLDRIEADFGILRRAFTRSALQPITTRRTNAVKQATVLSMLDTHPELSDREIARRIGVSPQTVNTWRKKHPVQRDHAR